MILLCGSGINSRTADVQNNCLSLDGLFVVLLHIYPVFALAVRKWVAISEYATVVIAVLILLRDFRRREKPVFYPSSVWLFVGMFAGLPVAVLVGQLFRMEFAIRNFDSPIRFLIVIPVFLVIYRQRIDALGYFIRMLPLTLGILLVEVLLWPDLKWGGRLTTYFVDPLTFGSITLLLGSLAAVSIGLISRKKSVDLLLRVLTFFVGVGLSVASGSRTGWAALPLVILIWGWVETAGHRFQNKIRGIVLVAIVIAVALIYNWVPTVHTRVGEAVNDLRGYSWNSVNGCTSVGYRISFYRMATALVLDQPLSGYADSEMKTVLYKDSFRRFSTKETSDFIVSAGFHSEFYTNAVRSGVWGGLATVALCFVPLALIVNVMRSGDSRKRHLALVGATYLCFIVISGLTTEVFNLKYTTSFHALMMASIYGTLLWNRPESSES